MRLALVSEKLSQESLTRLAEEDLSAELTSIPGVATVELFGDQEQVLRVVVDPIRLASYGLSIDEVANVLSSLSLDVPAGSFKSNDQLLMVRADASVWRPKPSNVSLSVTTLNSAMSDRRSTAQRKRKATVCSMAGRLSESASSDARNRTRSPFRKRFKKLSND